MTDDVTPSPGRGHVFDVAEREALRWRRFGEEAEGDDSGDEAAAGPITMSDVMRNQHELDEEEGTTVQEEGMRAMGELPFQVQQAMAAKYRDFADKFRARLAALVESGGEGHVVSESDIAAIMEDVKNGR